jgi:tetratricopeptide (TPR) repeat protein
MMTKDFFISYTGADRLWAEWVAWQLEEAGYSIVFQESFPASQDFVHAMQTTLEETDNILAILSPDYVDALSISSEWSEALRIDPSGKQRVLLPIQVRETRNHLKSVLALLSYIDLVGLDERKAREILLESVSRVSSGSLSSPVHTLVTAKQPRFPGSFPPIWNVPYARNPYFTGREELLTQLAETLRTEKIMSVAQPQAISGLGGIGKTQLALEYAYRYRQNYEAVFWVMADGREALMAGYTDIARLVGLAQHTEHDQSLTILAVKQWLQRHVNWLLILDNADELAMVREFLPSAPSGHIILTTRAFSMGSLAERLEVKTLIAQEGVLFLLLRAGLIRPDSTLQEVPVHDITQAHAIVEMLGGLPLALDQAGAYIQETGCSLQDYVQLYMSHRAELLASRGSLVESHPEPVATTWALAFEKITISNPAAVELLQLCAFLAPDDIPEELIIDGSPDLSPTLTSLVKQPIAWNMAIATLLMYSLIRRNSSRKTLSTHRLVQAILLETMDEVIACQWAERAVRIVNRAFPSGEFETWPQCDRMLPHALRCADWIDHYHLFFPEVIHLLNRTGYYLSERAHYREAEVLWRRALAMSEQLLGSEHLDTATSLNNLAQLYYLQGKYAEAEPLYLKSLAIREHQLDPEYPEIAISLNNLAELYRNQGKYTEAESLLVRALAIHETHLGAEHTTNALSLNNLAGLYKSLGKYEQAKPLYIRALSIREQQLGTNHPDTASSLNNLAELYRDQGKYTEAEPLLKRALMIYEQQLGPQHPDTAQSLNNLAVLRYLQGKYDEIEPLLKRALMIYEQQLGPQHLDTAQSLNNLAVLYDLQGKYDEAGPLLKRALMIYEQQLGPQHPSTAMVRQNLAFLYPREKQTNEETIDKPILNDQQEHSNPE